MNTKDIVSRRHESCRNKGVKRVWFFPKKCELNEKEHRISVCLSVNRSATKTIFLRFSLSLSLGWLPCVYSEFSFVLFFTICPHRSYRAWHSSFRCCSDANRDWRTAIAYASVPIFCIFSFLNSRYSACCSANCIPSWRLIFTTISVKHNSHNVYAKLLAKVEGTKVHTFIVHFYIFRARVLYVIFSEGIFFHDEEWKYNFTLCETYYTYFFEEKEIFTDTHFRRYIFNDRELSYDIIIESQFYK